MAEHSPSSIGPLRAEDILYRAITRGSAFDVQNDDAVTSDAFRLRPGEPTLSVALTVDKALGCLNYKGYTQLCVADVAELGLELRVKPDENDQDLLEICGIPEDEQRRTDIAIALAKIANMRGHSVRLKPPKAVHK